MLTLYFQLVEQFLTDNVKVQGTGPEVAQSQLYIGMFIVWPKGYKTVFFMLISTHSTVYKNFNNCS